MTKHENSIIDQRASNLSQLAISLTTQEQRARTPFGLYLVGHADDRSELGRHVERSVFEEFFSESDEILRDEYAAYENSSLFLVILDHEKHQPAGTVRLILPSIAGFKALNDLKETWGVNPEVAIATSVRGFDVSKAWEIATIAILPEYRSSTHTAAISLALVQGVITLGAMVGVETGLAIFDVVALELIQTVCGDAWKPIAGIEPQRYLGSPASIVCFCDMSEYGPRLASTNPDLYEILWHGSLINGFSSPEWGEWVNQLRDGDALDLPQTT